MADTFLLAGLHAFSEVIQPTWLVPRSNCKSVFRLNSGTELTYTVNRGTFYTIHKSLGKPKYLYDLQMHMTMAMSDAVVSLENLILHTHFYIDFNHTGKGFTK